MATTAAAAAPRGNPYNPFEDSLAGTNPGRNPFDDDDGDGDIHGAPSAESAASSSGPQLVQPTDFVDQSLPVEASWQYLGDIPYRRVPIYSHVSWAHRRGGGGGNGDPLARHLRNLSTRLVGCPNGGPLATVSIPLRLQRQDAGGDSGTDQTELRIQTNSGSTIAVMDFPPPSVGGGAHGPPRRYSAADITAIGFTSRAVLIVVMSDSLCFTYGLDLEPVLPPFHILPGASTELQHAAVFEGGVAVLAKNQACAIVELLDDHDDPLYQTQAHVAARVVTSTNTASSSSGTDPSAAWAPAHYALVTPLPTAVYASEHRLAYLALAVLPRSRTGDRPEVFLSTADRSVVVCRTDASVAITDVDCRSRMAAPIVAMSVAPNGRFLACFTEAAMLTVVSTSFETKVLDFDTSEGAAAPPLDMKWCGEDSVVLHWKNLGVLMVGPFGDWLRFPFENTENLYIVPELDCCRVVTDGAVELLQRVPPATARLLRLGSIETSAMLLDASDAFAAGAPTADAALRGVEPEVLLEAVETCAEAAAREFDIATQKRLLRAASYGLQFSYKGREAANMVMGGPTDGSVDGGNGVLPSTATVKFVKTCKKIRCLNQLRSPRVGFVMTSSQYDAITPTGVVGRLCRMKRPSFAAALSKYLQLPHSVQLYARALKACALVEADKSSSDSELAEEAIRIINGGASASLAPCINRGGYATVAMAANRADRPGVANLLLTLESSVADKIPTLLSNGSYADAIAVATTHRDADFIFSIIMEYERVCLLEAISSDDVAKARAAFFGMVSTKFTPEAFHMLRRYLIATSTGSKDAVALLLRAQRFTDAGSTIALRAIKNSDPRERQGMLQEASRVFASGKETAFQKSSTDDQMELLKDLDTLRTKYSTIRIDLDGCSVIGTMSALIHAAGQNEREQHRLLGDVDKIARRYRVSEKRLWAVKVKAFGESKQWSNLRTLAESKKSPIGYKPFARVAIRGKQPVSEVMRYIAKVSSPEEKYDLLVECKLWKDALEEAYKLKDARRIIHVKGLCNDTDLQLVADQLLGRMAQ